MENNLNTQDGITTTFHLVEFNPRRESRGAEAARVQVIENGTPIHWLWMSRADLRENIKEFGECEAFTLALKHYETKQPYEVPFKN